MGRKLLVLTVWKKASLTVPGTLLQIGSKFYLGYVHNPRLFVERIQDGRQYLNIPPNVSRCLDPVNFDAPWVV